MDAADGLIEQLRFFQELGVTHLNVPASAARPSAPVSERSGRESRGAEGRSEEPRPRPTPPRTAPRSSVSPDPESSPAAFPVQRRRADQGAAPQGPAHLSGDEAGAEYRPPTLQPGEMSLIEIRRTLGDCRRCPLCRTRTQIVYGVGNPDADLMFVGEAPGQDEDEVGFPFVGRAGALLSKIVLAMGMNRDEVYVANILKCRPPSNRDPLPEEVETCGPFLFKQIEAIRPKVIVTLGRYASQSLLRTDTPISRLRGRFTDFNGIPLMPTYHPSYLLRTPSAKRNVWEDMKQVRARLDELTAAR